jgi:hypothetical protein
MLLGVQPGTVKVLYSMYSPKFFTETPAFFAVSHRWPFFW